MTDINWVERKHAAAKKLAEGQPGLWRDLCAALTDACRSFNKLYSGRCKGIPVNGHRFRVVMNGERQREIDLDFNDQESTIAVSYDTSIMWSQKTIAIKSDQTEAFLVDEKNGRMTADQASEAILDPCFFPAQ